MAPLVAFRGGALVNMFYCVCLHTIDSFEAKCCRVWEEDHDTVDGKWQSVILLCFSDETGGRADMLTSTPGWNLKRRRGAVEQPGSIGSGSRDGSLLLVLL